MKTLNSILVIFSLTMLMSCVATDQSDDEVDSITPQEAEAIFRERIKPVVEDFERNEAIASINPCHDTVQALSFAGGAGKFSVSNNVEFDFTFMSGSPYIASECNLITPIPDNETAGKRAYLADDDRSITTNGDYTVIIATKGVATTLTTDDNAQMAIIQGDGAFGVYATVPQQGQTDYYIRSEYKQLDGAPNTTTIASFSFEKSTNMVKVHGFNTKYGEFQGTDSLNPNLTGVESPDIGEFSIKSFSLTMNRGQNDGLLYFAVFPKIVSEEEKKMLMCYGMFISAVKDDTSLLKTYNYYCGI